MLREREDMPQDVIPVSLIDRERFHFRLVNFPTGRASPLPPHVNHLGVIYPMLRTQRHTVILTGHASARNNSGVAGLNHRLSEGRCLAIRDEILRNVPGAVIEYHAEGDRTAAAEVKLGAVTANTGYYRSVSVKVVSRWVPPPPPIPPKKTSFLIGIANRITIKGIGIPALPTGAGKDAARKVLEKVPARFRKRLSDLLKRVGKVLVDEYDVPTGFGAGLVQVSGDVVIKDQTRNRQAISKFTTYAVCVTEGEIGVVYTVLGQGGFTPFRADDRFDATTFTAGGALLDFAILRTEGDNLVEFFLFSSIPGALVKTEPSRLRIPFKQVTGNVPLFLSIADAKLAPA